MKKTLLGTIVAGLILFVWQFVSWSGANLHSSQLSYTPLESDLLECLSTHKLPEGEYLIPNKPPEMSMTEYQELFNSKYLGRPWARIQYHHSFENSMGMNMFRGLIIDLLSAFLLCIVLLGDPTLDFKKVMITSLTVGIIAYLTIPYLNSIWFKSNSLPDLLDAIVPWTLIGLILGKILPNKQ
jgi:hypothetical protein